MYWLYLIIFTLIVFVPTAVRHGIYGLTASQTQEFAILILGSLGFLTFLVQEKRLKKMSAQFFETVASHDFSKREISKTINHSIFSQNEE